MASKLRRTPLLPYDGNYNNYGPYTTATNSNVKSPNTTNTKKMECSLAGSPYTNGGGSATTVGILSSGGEVRGGGGSTVVGGGVGVGGTERSPAKVGLHVNFKEKGEVKERREKFLTAKYGNHQMSLIRKRLAVEMWLYEELKKLYETTSKQLEDDEVEVDIDELLDMDSDDERRRHLQTLLIDAKKSQNDVKKFINDLLDKAKTL